MDRLARYPQWVIFWVLLLLATPVTALGQSTVYFPGKAWDWERRDPGEVGMSAALLQEAVDFALASESTSPRDLELNHYMSFGREPHGFAIGPFKERGPMAGMVVRNGYVVAEWGDTRRVDMTFSVTKSFLSSTVGLAWDRTLIADVDDRVGLYMAPVDLPPGDGEPGIDRDGYGNPDPVVLFQTEHNRKITWRHLLQQNSDWEGTLWGKPDWAGRPQGPPTTWLTRERNEPGTVYKYNETRVNLLALAALQVWRRPLPQVLREYLMDPIGASNTWRWNGYENSWVTVDGAKVQSVSGGWHWGGGMFICAQDQARFGYLTLRDGRWKDRQILSQEWIEMAKTPSGSNPGYGFMNFFLNTGQRSISSAPESAFSHRGAGTNLIYVDKENDLVVVVRWIQGGAIDDFIQRVLASIEG
jgi:CubicO group peptidase (beta-lactamase class C family)